MVHALKKIFQKQKKPVATANKNDDIENETTPILFGVEKTLKGHTGGVYSKKVFSFSSTDGANYAMYAPKKIPFAKELSAALLDAVSGGYNNVAIDLGKKIALVRHTGGEEASTYEIEFIDHSDNIDDLQLFAENYFQGYGFKVIDNIKEVVRFYVKDDAVKYRILALIIMAIMGIFFYSEYQKRNQHENIKPPMPRLPKVTSIEESDLKRTISIDVFHKMLDAIDKISKNSSPQDNVVTTRIVNIHLNPYKKKPMQKPFYDKEDNKWYYNNEKTKRGGLDLKYSFTTEKSYPENGYEFRTRVGDKNIYEKSDSGFIAKNFDPNKSKDRYINVSTGCLKKATSLGRIKKRTDNILEIILNSKGKTNYQMVKEISDLLDNCPVYANALSISGNGNVEGNIYYYYKFKDKK